VPENVRWVAISGDGGFVTAVANRLNADKQARAGLLVALSLEDGQLCKVWDKKLDRNPNSTSMNAAGTYIGLADGYPLGNPGQFRLFDRNGNELWSYTTSDMNWPMVVSADGAGIAAGGDDGNVYYLSESEICYK
jgi:outer membrane protein assembly factor BamB